MHSGAISSTVGHLEVFRIENILQQTKRVDWSNLTSFLILNV